MKKKPVRPTSAFKRPQAGRELWEKKLALFSPLCRIKITKLETFMQMSESEGDRAKLVQR